MTKDDAKARAAFTAARAEQEKLVQAHPDNAGAVCVLGLIEAGLGQEEEALREGRRAAELLPVEKDRAPGYPHSRVFGNDRCVGRRQQSCLAGQRHSVSDFAQLWSIKAVCHFWDPLRGDPCFENIVASVAPK